MPTLLRSGFEVDHRRWVRYLSRGRVPVGAMVQFEE
jgi:hypothetical protein